MNEKYQEMERMKEQLLETTDSMHAAIEAAGIYYFEYYPDYGYALQFNGREDFELNEREDNYPECWFDKKITHEEDEHILRDAFARLKEGSDKENCTVRNYINGEYRWNYYNFTTIYNSSGIRTKVVFTAQDVTDMMKVKELNQSYNKLYSRVPGWIFTCQDDNMWTMQQTNAHIFSLTGYTEEEFRHLFNSEVGRLIPEEYHHMIHRHIQMMKENGNGSSANYDVPIVDKKGSLVWINVNIYWDGNENDGMLYVVCSDISKLKAHEEELLESNTMYKLTTDNARISFWKYDIQNDIMYNTEGAEKYHVGDKTIHNFIPFVLQSNSIRSDSIEEFKHLYERIKEGEESASADIWYRKRDNSGWWCERTNYSTIFDENGLPVKAFGIGSDVTELKNATERIEEEKKAQEEINSDKILMKTRANLSKDTVELIEISDNLVDHGHVNQFTQGVRNLIDNAYTETDAIKVEEKLSVENIMQAAEKNEIIAFEYRRKNRKGHSNWVQITVKSYINLEENDVIAFVYMYDINQEKSMNTILNKIADADYEVLALIHADTDDIEAIRKDTKDDNMVLDYSLSYSEAIDKFVDTYVIEEDKQQALEAFDIRNIMNRLEENPIYEISFGTHGNSLYQKKWEYAYFDETKSTIIYSRTDITQVFVEQENQKRALHDALMQAEEASNAKTNFLSRMSHEIRTPMNAIIGMNTIATQVADDPREVRDCLAKIGISARFLLSLINDILDMSRIESGKVIISQHKFPLEELVQSVNTIFSEQAEKRGIDYDCVIASFVSDYYVGDAMKIQQILVNLLGNAVKFTREGGKVQLIIRQERVSNGTAFMSFSVNDTGIGISKDFQDKMFEPFEQADTSTTSPYKGTGLGLAIAKNLINMMGGSIQVHSIEGIGTEFVVRIPLGLCEEEEVYHKLNINMSIDKLKTLIVDDDVTICEHTKQLLAEIGMKAEWVESGYRAVEIIQKKWDNKEFFDVVLLDWKMPDMDGIETARKIRKIVGDDVTIIVMTAYDWAEIEMEAKQAGVNLLVTKPLFKSSIISVFETAFHNREEKTVREIEREYDFTGKNILLVEDHILNVEIAKKLLKIKNAQVDVAENGLRAIEMFTEAKDGFYDAVLMDIRMPIMDGLTATKSIRHLRKEYAATVPIIAMSANAFDEDVEKSKEAGMNEHLSKPIEPHMLYAALEKWFQKGKNENEKNFDN